MFNCSRYVADRGGTVLFIRKNNQLLCSESWDDAYRLIFKTKANVEYIDVDNEFSTLRIDAKADVVNSAFTIYTPLECGNDGRLLKITYCKSDGISEEIIENSTGGIPYGVVQYTPQDLTADQQAQARENIDVVSLAETVSRLEGASAASLELFAGLAWTPGYYNTNGTVTASLSESKYYGYVSVTQEKVPVVAGGTYNCVLRVPADKSLREGNDKSTLEITFAEYDVNGAWIRRNKLTLPASTIEGDYEVVRTSYTPASNVRYVCAATRTFRTDADGSKVLSVVNAAATTSPMRLLPLIGDTDSGKIVRVEGDTYALADMPVPTFVARNPHFIAVNHRGYSLTAPENTLSAYKLSRRMGFAYAECDVAFTSDGVAVLLHDGTVDRTSNGTGSITSLTLAEVKALDFGS